MTLRHWDYGLVGFKCLILAVAIKMSPVRPFTKQQWHFRCHVSSLFTGYEVFDIPDNNRTHWREKCGIKTVARRTRSSIAVSSLSVMTAKFQDLSWLQTISPWPFCNHENVYTFGEKRSHLAIYDATSDCQNNRWYYKFWEISPRRDRWLRRERSRYMAASR